MSEARLGPCSRCGGEAVMARGGRLLPTGRGEEHAAMCPRCGEAGPRRATEEMAARAWNDGKEDV